MPPGEPTTAPPGDLVVYASLSHAEQIVGYRLGSDGLLPRDPFTSVDLADKPRTMVLSDNFLYVLLDDRVISFSIEPDGTLPSVPTSETAPLNDPGGVDMLLQNDVLYVAFEDLNRVYAYRLVFGLLPSDPISISGTSTSDYRSLVATNDFLYAASLGDARVDTYRILSDGSLPPAPEAQEPDTNVFRPEDMVIRGRTLYAITQSRERIEAFDIQTNGLPDDDFDSRTNSEQRYARLLLDGDLLYASGLSLGRIDVYRINSDGSLSKDPPFGRTAKDTSAFPIGMALEVGIIYVAQSGLDRIDAYILNADGSPAAFPSSSTDQISDSFPIDVAVGSFPQ